MLVCLDCWDQEHHKLLNVIDKETASMMLVSTRIAGLISSDACTQVKLSLMSTKVQDCHFCITVVRFCCSGSSRAAESEFGIG